MQRIVTATVTGTVIVAEVVTEIVTEIVIATGIESVTETEIGIVTVRETDQGLFRLWVHVPVTETKECSHHFQEEKPADVKTATNKKIADDKNKTGKKLTASFPSFCIVSNDT